MLNVMKQHLAMVFTALLMLAVIAKTPAHAGESALWGRDGEAWSPQSRLPDYSWAGYHCGDRPIPKVPAATQAGDVGLTGDGVTDDAPALQKALDTTRNGAVVLPPGRFLINSPVTIRHGNVVLRGSGSGKTVLVIPRSLQRVQMAAKPKAPKVTFSFSGGFITIEGEDRGQKLTSVAQPVPRGSRLITLSDDITLKVGSRVRVVMGASKELGREIHGGEDAGPRTLEELKEFFSQIVTVVAVDGRLVTVDQPMRIAVKPEWGASLWSFEPTVEEVGIEGLTFEFPGVPKKAHLLEEGFNAVFMRGVSNCWVSDIETIDADNGVNMQRSNFCTVRNVVCRAVKRPSPSGHHALWCKGTQDCLFTDFDIRTLFIHDLSVEGRAIGNVFMKGRGESLCLDHHRNAPYENLFTHLDVGDPSRLWESSGMAERGPHTGVRETFWNIRHNGSKLPVLPSFMQANFIGIAGYQASASNKRAQWIEPVPDGIDPANLYEAQLARRLATSGLK